MLLHRRTTGLLLCALLPAIAGCFDGRERTPRLQVDGPGLNCDAIASARAGSVWKPQAPYIQSVSRSQFLTLEASEAVLRHFDEIGYDFHGVREASDPVPRVYLAKMPGDLSEIDEIATRKRLFLAALLPALLQVNEELRETRRRLVAVDSCEHAGFVAAKPVRDWIAALAERYRTKASAGSLLEKVGEIPPSMALAQAAVESGWGTSKPARSGNSLFGQYTYDEDENGNILKETVRLASFDSVLAAVQAYADNLNTHRAYREFRKLRLDMIRKGEPLDGLKLMEALDAYSERRDVYVRAVQGLIRYNGLSAFDTADLAHRIDLAMNDVK